MNLCLDIPKVRELGLSRQVRSWVEIFFLVLNGYGVCGSSGTPLYFLLDSTHPGGGVGERVGKKKKLNIFGFFQ